MDCTYLGPTHYSVLKQTVQKMTIYLGCQKAYHHYGNSKSIWFNHLNNTEPSTPNLKLCFKLYFCLILATLTTKPHAEVWWWVCYQRSRYLKHMKTYNAQ